MLTDISVDIVFDIAVDTQPVSTEISVDTVLTDRLSVSRVLEKCQSLVDTANSIMTDTDKLSAAISARYSG